MDYDDCNEDVISSGDYDDCEEEYKIEIAKC